MLPQGHMVKHRFSQGINTIKKKKKNPELHKAKDSATMQRNDYTAIHNTDSGVGSSV
jgi:hypothetical protein